MVKYVKDFEFPTEFGFHGTHNTSDTSGKAGQDDSTYVGSRRAKGGKMCRAKGGKAGMLPDMAAAAAASQSDQPQEPIVSMPMSTARRLAQGFQNIGIHQGASAVAQKVAGAARGAPAPGGMPAAPPRPMGALSAPPPGAPPGGMPGGGMPARPMAPPAPAPMARAPMGAPQGAPMPAMAKGGHFIKEAVQHPGRMKALAKRHGVSTHEEMERDKHSSDPSLRSAANLGLRLTRGDLKPHRGRKD